MQLPALIMSRNFPRTHSVEEVNSKTQLSVSNDDRFKAGMLHFASLATDFMYHWRKSETSHLVRSQLSNGVFQSLEKPCLRLIFLLLKSICSAFHLVTWWRAEFLLKKIPSVPVQSGTEKYVSQSESNVLFRNIWRHLHPFHDLVCQGQTPIFNRKIVIQAKELFYVFFTSYQWRNYFPKCTRYSKIY